MNDHFSTRKPRVHSEKEDLEFCAFGLMESDVEFPRADEIAVGTMTRIRLTCSSVGCEEHRGNRSLIGASCRQFADEFTAKRIAWAQAQHKEVNNRTSEIRAIRNPRHVA